MKPLTNTNKNNSVRSSAAGLSFDREGDVTNCAPKHRGTGGGNLLPCPWCGELPAIIERPFRIETLCANLACKIQPKVVKSPLLSGAIHFWNHYAKTTIPN
jgi:hypothetical protein